MKVLLLSNMYPNKGEIPPCLQPPKEVKDSYFGSFVKEQVMDLENNGVEIIRVVRTSENIISYFPFFLKSIYYLLFKDYDLIHAHYGFHSALPALILKFAPLIVTYHGSDALEEPRRHFLYHWLQVITVKRATHIIAVSNEIKEVLILQLCAKSHKISVISCGVDSSLFKPFDDKKRIRKELGLPENKPIVLFIGSFSHRKGIDIVYRCATVLQDVKFILIGGTKPETQKPRTSDLSEVGVPIYRNCIIVGSKPHREITKWLNASDIFLLPSRSEGVPVSLLEALSCGIPAITSSVGGIPEVMEDGKTGWMVDSNDVDLIISRIKQLLGDQAQKNHMAKYSREVTIKKFDKSIITEKIKKVYKNVMQ